MGRHTRWCLCVQEVQGPVGSLLVGVRFYRITTVVAGPYVIRESGEEGFVQRVDIYIFGDKSARLLK